MDGQPSSGFSDHVRHSQAERHAGQMRIQWKPTQSNTASPLCFTFGIHHSHVSPYCSHVSVSVPVSCYIVVITAVLLRNKGQQPVWEDDDKNGILFGDLKVVANTNDGRLLLVMI